MAVEEVKVRTCDVWGTRRQVMPVVVIVKRPDAKDEEAILTFERDLSPKAMERLERFITRGCTPPPGRGPDTNADEDDHDHDAPGQTKMFEDNEPEDNEPEPDEPEADNDADESGDDGDFGPELAPEPKQKSYEPPF